MFVKCIADIAVGVFTAYRKNWKACRWNVWGPSAEDNTETLNLKGAE
jgi:hypothetical protein